MTQAPPISRFPSGQTLLLDADDTLWENNIYFERAIAAFISCLDHRDYSPAEVRAQAQRSRARDHPHPRLRSLQLPPVADHLLRASLPKPLRRPLHRHQARPRRRLRPIHNRPGDRAPPRRRRDAARARLAPPPHPRHQGQPRRTSRQIPALRPPGPLHRSRDSTREKSRRLPRHLHQIRARAPHHLDDRQQPKVRHQPRPGRRSPRRRSSIIPSTWVLEHEAISPAPEGQHFA